MKIRLLFILLTLTACQTDNSAEKRLKLMMSNIETLVTSDSIDEYSLDNMLTKINDELQRSFDRNAYTVEENRELTSSTVVRYNGDSSLVFIKYKMNWKNGFKRETIISIGDTLLFVKSFEVMTDKENPNDYELVEYIDYLKPEENIVTVNRYMYPAKLTDTLSFRQDGLRRFTSNLKFEFETEIENARGISRKWN